MAFGDYAALLRGTVPASTLPGSQTIVRLLLSMMLDIEVNTCRYLSGCLVESAIRAT